MKEKTILDEIELNVEGEPKKELPDETIIYDWDGEVVNEAE